MVVECLNKTGAKDEDDHIEYYTRSRIAIEIEPYVALADRQYKKAHEQDQKAPTSSSSAKKNLVLNEVMISEKDASMLSVYRLNVDGRDLGKFRSSGILIATGTGSTGWLYAAR